MKNVLKKHISLAIDATLPSNNHSRFRNNVSERIYKLIMTLMMKLEMKNWNTVLTEKQQKYQHYHLK